MPPSVSRSSYDDDTRSKARGSKTSTIFNISSWPSNDHLLDQNETKDSKALCPCVKKNGKLSIIEGKERSNRPTIAVIDYFVNEIEKPNGKINASDPALITKSRTYTFQELHEHSDRIAMVLKSKLDGKTTKNPDGHFVIGMSFPGRNRRVLLKLAILKTGCCFFPIDYTNFPPNRILKSVELIKPILIITTDDPEISEKLKVVQDAHIEFETITIQEILAEVEANRAEKIRDRNSLVICQDYDRRPMVIFFAFGPTGPQGVRISNIAVWNRIMWEWETFPYDKDEVLILQSHAWEVNSLGEMFTPLLAGKPILITERLHVDRLLEDVWKHKITRLAVVPSFLGAILTTLELHNQAHSSPNQNILGRVKLWFCYRASLRAELALEFFDNVPSGTKLVQIHGAGESLNISSYKVFNGPKNLKKLAFYEILPTGKPVTNMKIYVMDAENNPVEQGLSGEICFSGIQLPYGIAGSSEEIVPNPLYKHGDPEYYKFLLKSGDYGKMLPNGELIMNGRLDLQAIMNNQRVNIQEILDHLKAIKGIKGCHAMTYRPTTTDQTVLAFAVVSRQTPISATEIMEQLRENIPEYMMPVVVILQGIPIKDFEVDQAALVEAYFQDREDRVQFDDWDNLGLDTAEQIKAAKILFDVMFTLTRISKRQIAENMNDSIFHLRARFGNVPSILLMLRRSGYRIGFDEFIQYPNVRALIVKMASSRESIGDGDRIASLQAYKVETINPSMQKEVLQCFSNYFANNGTNHPRGARRSLFYYAEIKKADVHAFSKFFWNLIISKPLSVFLRRTKDHKIVAGLFNVGFEDKKGSKVLQKATYPFKYVLELFDQFDQILTVGDCSDLLQTVFIMVDNSYFENFDNAVSTINELFKTTFDLARSMGFKRYAILSFDYIISRFTIDLLDFELLSTIQINSFKALDGKKPFKLAPDHVIGSLLIKSL